MTHKRKGNSAIILGLTANGLGVARSLGRRGVECYGIYCSKDEEVGYISKYLKCSTKISGNWSDEILLDQLHALSEKADITPCVLFPTSDVYVRFIARHKSRLENSFFFHYTEETLLSLLNDKSRTEELNLFGLHLPFTVYPHGVEDLEEFTATHCFPAIIKPVLSDVFDFPDKVVLVSGSQELQNFFHTHPFLFGNCIIQEFIAGGDEATWEVLSFSAENCPSPMLCILHKIRQYPPASGLSSFLCTEYNSELKNTVTKALKMAGYYGLADWEFLYDQKQKRFVLIDINCRPGMPNQVCSDAGVDLIWAAYNNLVHKQLPDGSFSESQRDNLYYVNFEWDIGSFYRKRNEGAITVVEWLRSLMRARSFAFFSIQDPLPFLLTAVKMIKLVSRKLSMSLH